MIGEHKRVQERLSEIVRRFRGRRVLVIGDAIADQFVYGGISRVSREAPVFIIRHEHTETIPGGAANCATNLAALGANVSLVGIAGDDEPGRALRERLERADVKSGGLLKTDIRTTTKVRILAGQTHSTRQQVVRVDYEDQQPISHEMRNALKEKILQEAQQQDAIIISDYNYGVVDREIADTIRDIGRANTTPVLVDSRFSLMSFPGFTSATPNETEVEQLLGRQTTSVKELFTAAEQMRRDLGYKALLITRGGQGMVLLEDGVPPLNLNAVGSLEPVDVTGAGDTVIATYALALSSDASFSDAARLANYAGGLVVMKRGTASVSSEELLNSVMHSEAEA